MERDILSFVDRDRLVPIVGRAAIAGGNSQKLNFEYHAFVFAYRRALDYLTIAIAALLRQEFRSYRKLPGLLTQHAEHTWVSGVLGVHAKYVPQLKTFLGSETEKSARDKIALGAVINEYVRIIRDLIAETLSAMASGLPKGAVEQIGRERRERVSQLDSSGDAD